MGNFTIKNLRRALACALFILPFFSAQGQNVEMVPDTIFLCNDGSYQTIDTIRVMETAIADFAAEGPVTYRFAPPAGFEFQPGVGSITANQASSFDFNFLNIQSSFVELVYTANATSSTVLDTLYFTGLMITATAPGSSGDIDRVASSGTEASHASNGLGANSHGFLISNTAITVSPSTVADISCNGLNDGSITVNASGGSNISMYSNDGGSTFGGSNVFSPLSAGTYDIQVMDDSGCVAIGPTDTIVDPPVITISTETFVNVTCNGAADGSITIAASGGTGALEYSIDNGTGYQASGSFTGLSGLSYDIIVRDANLCTTLGSSGTLNEPAALSFNASGLTDPTCNGGSDGQIVVNVAGGTAPYQYSIDNGSTFSSSNTFSGLSAGSYDLDVTDANSCALSGPTENLTDPTAITITSVTPTAVVCNGDGDGQIDFVASGGTGGLSYSIDGGSTYQAGANFSGLAPGSYDPAVRDASGCEVFDPSVAVTEPSALVISSEIITAVSCNAGSDGEIEIVASGGTGAIEYSIDNGSAYQAGNTFTGLGAIGYDIEVRDANLCVTNGSNGTISQPSALSFNASGLTDPTCNGGSDGQIVVNVTGGTGPYLYSIDNGSTFFNSNTFSGLSAGSYDLDVIDANSCALSGPTENLSDPAAISITSVTPTDVQCNGASDGTIVIAASGGNAPLNYSIDGGSSYQAGTTFTGLAPGSYDPAVRDATGCEVFDPSVAIAQPSALSIISESIVDISCNGLTDGSITITANGGTPAINYSIDGGSSFQASNTFTGLGAIAYDIEIEDANGCGLVGSSGNIIEPTALSTGSANVTDVTTAGGSDGIISVIGTSGGTAPYSYSLDGGATTQTSPTFTGLPSGGYIVTVIDANGCTGNITGITVNEPGGFSGGSIDINGGTSEDVCVGASTPVVNLNNTGVANGGNTDSTLSYQWQSSPDGAVWTDIVGATGLSYAVPTPYTTTSFYRRGATRGDDPGNPFQGPVYSNFVVLNVQALPSATINIPDNILCVEGGSILLSGFPLPGGGATGVFTSVPAAGLTDNGNGSATFDPGAAAVTNHSITYTYTDAIGCADNDNDNIDVRQNSGVTLTSSKTNYLITDPTDALIGSPTGGVYSGPGVSGASFTPSIAGLGAHVLTYTQTDVDGCVGIDNRNVNVLDTGGSQIRYLDPSYCEYADTSIIRASLPVAATNRAPFWRLTDGGGAATPGLTIINDSVAEFDPTAVTLNNTTLTVSFLFSKGGNPDSVTAEVIVYTRPVVSIVGSSDSVCQDVTSVPFTGIPSAASGIWSAITPGASFTDNGDGTMDFFPVTSVTGVNELVYTFTNTFTTCVNTDTIRKEVNPLPNPVITNVVPEYCSNALDEILIATPAPSSGISGLFVGSGLSDNGDGTAAFVPSSLPAGNYTLSYVFTDNNGCMNSADSGITIIQKPSLSFDIPSLNYCENEPRDTLVNVSPVGGTFSGMGMSGSSPVFFPTNPGNNIGVNTITYIYVDGVSGCSDTLSKDLTLHAKPIVQFLNLLPDYCAVVGGTITINTDAPTNGIHSWGLVPDPGGTAILGNNVATVDIDQLTPSTNYTVNYIFTEIGGNSCRDSVSGNFLLEPLPVVSFTMTDESGSLRPGDPVHWCRNEDSILLQANFAAGTFFPDSFGADISNIGGGQAYFSPFLTYGRPGNNSDRRIRYNYTEPSTGCENNVTITQIVNDLPNPLSMTGWGMVDPMDGKAYFCTEDDSAVIYGNPPPSFNQGNAYIKMDKPNNSTFGGIFVIDSTKRLDSIFFKPKLVSDDYFVQYVFIDSLGCTDSVEQNVFINAEPRISARIDGALVIDGLPDSICTNDPLRRRLQVVDSAVSELDPVPDSTVQFFDLTESGTILQDTAGRWYFYPQNGTVLGIHTISFEYESAGGGCRDDEIFQINLLDTPTVSISNLLPDYCRTALNRDILITGSGTIAPGSGFFTESADLTLVDNGDNTANFFPDDQAWAQNQSITFTYTEEVSGKGCVNSVTYPVDINPLPDTRFFFSKASVCHLDTTTSILSLVDTINAPANAWDDSTYGYKSSILFTPTTPNAGVDTTGFDNGQAQIVIGDYDPIALNMYTDSGVTDIITFIRTSTEGCTDSSTREIRINPTPRINFLITDKGTGDSVEIFCNQQGAPRFDLTLQNFDNLFGSVSFDGDGTIGQDFDPEFTDPGVVPVSTIFTTIPTGGFNGCTSYDTVYARVYAEPKARFVVGNFCQYDPIQFTDLSIADDTTDVVNGRVKEPDTVVAWRWDFDVVSVDTSNLQNPTHQYAGSGNYTTELVITTAKGCTNDTDTTFHIGEPPIADFSWDEICESKDVTFTDRTIFDNDAFQWSWTLAPGVTDTAQNPITTYSQAGPYQVRLIVQTLSNCFDTAIKTIDIRPVITVGGTNPNYLSDFDNDIIEWRPGDYASGTNYSWEQAPPTGNVINSTPENTTTNVWVTNADSTHLFNENSFVMGPCFDFSASLRPMIKIPYWNDSDGGTSGAVLQASTNKGRDWVRIGDLGTGKNWYNADPIIGNPGDQDFSRVGWSGSTSGWRDSRHQLDVLRQNDDVLLRIAFGSDSVSNVKEGFAFGNIEILERSKKVLIEHFSNTSNQTAVDAVVEHNNLMDNNLYDVYDVQFHTDFPGADPANLDNPSDNSTRSFIYSISSVPRTVMEGNQYSGSTVDFTGSSYRLSNGKHELIQKRILEDAKFDVDVITNKTQTGVNGSIVVTAREDIGNIKLRIQTAVIESYIDNSSYPGYNFFDNTTFRSTMKKMLPDAIGTFVERAWTAGEQQTYNFNYTYDPATLYDPDTVNVVGFVQDGNTREIYQVNSDDSTKIYDPLALTPSWALDQSYEFILFPNPSSEDVYIRFEEVLNQSVSIRIFDQLGKVVLEERMMANEYDLRLDLDQIPGGVYFVEVGNKDSKTIKRLVKK